MGTDLFYMAALGSFLGMVTAWFPIGRYVNGVYSIPLRVAYFIPAFIFGEFSFFIMIAGMALTLVAALGNLFTSPEGRFALGLMTVSWFGLIGLQLQSLQVGTQLRQDLLTGLGDAYISEVHTDRRALLHQPIDPRQWARPFHYTREGVEVLSDIMYGDDASRHTLDIYRRSGGSEKCPVLLEVHGGGWSAGNKTMDAKPLLVRMARQGWVCATMDYGLAPKHKFPEQIIDVKRAIAWLRNHIQTYGGDPDHIVITGGSAGAQLSSLAALTPNIKKWQPGFEDIDTSVQASVHFYGAYDFVERRRTKPGFKFGRAYAKLVVPDTLLDDIGFYEEMSPSSHVNSDAPPMYLLHGTHDNLSPVKETRDFARDMRRISRQPVVCSEISGGGHCFDAVHTPRSSQTVAAVAEFLVWNYARWLSLQNVNADSGVTVVRALNR